MAILSFSEKLLVELNKYYMRHFKKLRLLILLWAGLHGVVSAAPEPHVQTQLALLEATTPGILGIAAIDTGTGQQINYHAYQSFPMGCTSKTIGVAAVLARAMKQPDLLYKIIKYPASALQEWSPVTKKHLADGMSVQQLCAAAIMFSDNTAMNLLLAQVGGLTGINAFARGIDADGYFQMDHNWPAEAAASPASRQDATTPATMENLLSQLLLGQVLAPTARKQLLDWLHHSVTGYARIRAGVPSGWAVMDKTGTGSRYGTTNDVAVIFPPHCRPLIFSIYYSSDIDTSPTREDVIAKATRILVRAFSLSDSCLKP